MRMPQDSTLTPSQGLLGLSRQTGPGSTSREVIDCSPLSLPDPVAEDTTGAIKEKTPTNTLTPLPLFASQGQGQRVEPYFSPVSPFVLNELKIPPASANKASEGHEGQADKASEVVEDTDEGMKQKVGSPHFPSFTHKSRTDPPFDYHPSSGASLPVQKIPWTPAAMQE